MGYEATLIIDDSETTDLEYQVFVATVAEALARANLYHCRGGRLPSLYRSGVIYRDLDGQDWRDASIILRTDKTASCVEASAWRVAELRCRGVPARPIVVPTGPNLFHCIVDGGDFQEDPSRRIGML